MNYVYDSGYVYVDLHSEEEVEKALKKNKDYIGEKSIIFNFIFYTVWVCQRNDSHFQCIRWAVALNGIK